MNLGGTIRLNKCGTCIATVLLILLLFYAFRNMGSSPKSEELVDLRRLLIGSIEAAVEGGRKVVHVYNSTNIGVRSKGKTKEGSNDPVTNADMMSHCAMYYSLTHTFPRVSVISEEKSVEGSCRTSQTLDLDPTVLKYNLELPEQLEHASDLTVWIDPLDATQEFTENLLQYVTTMVCVAVKGVPTLGVIHSPFTGETTWAWVGGNIPTVKSVSTAGNTAVLKVITSRSHMGDVEEIVQKALGKDVQIIRAGGAGYKSLQVASGNVSAYIHTTRIKKWDICAGDALLRAMHGKMTTLSGEDISYEATSDVVNTKGVLATLKMNEWFTGKLAPYLSGT